MCTLPEDISVSKAFPIGRKRRTPPDTGVIMFNDDGSPDSASNTLLRQLLVGTDPDRVRNYSDLVNAKFSLRRTSSMSLACRNGNPRQINVDYSSDELRPRRATMFSQLTLPRKSLGDSYDGMVHSKRSRTAEDSALNVKVESMEPEVPIKPIPDSVVVKPANKWRLNNKSAALSKSITPLVSSISTSREESIDIGSHGMRPRAHTASELENALEVFERCMLGKTFPNGGLARTSRSLDPISIQNQNGDINGDKSDMTSPLSQLLESTPPYTTNTHLTRMNPKVYPWLKKLPLSDRVQPTHRPRTATVAGVDSRSLRRLKTSNSSVTTGLQVLNLSQGSSPTNALTFIASRMSESAQNHEIPTSVTSSEGQVLNFSLKDNITTTNLLPLVNDDLLQATVLQQLFCRVGLPPAEVTPTSIGLTPSSSVSQRLTLNNLPPAWPIRLAAKNSHMICRRVGEWMLAADAYTMRCCHTIAPNALLATAASYRYCRCLESDQTPQAKIAVTHALPKISATLKSILTRIWPQLLLTYMIRENFAFGITPFSLTEFEAMTMERRGELNGSSSVDASDLLIARLGTAHALLNMIENGNQLLDSQVLECVRRCIFSQYAFPNYFSISYGTAMEDLRSCCQQCSGDSSLFANVLLLMNEMHSINPDGLHCLFSIDKLSALFSSS